MRRSSGTGALYHRVSIANYNIPVDKVSEEVEQAWLVAPDMFSYLAEPSEGNEMLLPRHRIGGFK
jgi:hypothetical protein